MTLGEKISKLRVTNKMSQGDLAEKLNVSRQSISKWETNASVPELDKLIQLCDLFGISLDELVLILCKEPVSHLNDITYIHLVLPHVIHLIEKYHLLNHRTLRKDCTDLCKLELRCDDIFGI